MKADDLYEMGNLHAAEFVHVAGDYYYCSDVINERQSEDKIAEGIYRLSENGETTCIYPYSDTYVCRAVATDETKIYWLLATGEGQIIVTYETESDTVAEYKMWEMNQDYGIYYLYFDGDTRYAWGVDGLYTVDDKLTMTKLELEDIGEVHHSAGDEETEGYNWVTDDAYIYVEPCSSDWEQVKILAVFDKNTGKAVSPYLEYMGIEEQTLVKLTDYVGEISLENLENGTEEGVEFQNVPGIEITDSYAAYKDGWLVSYWAEPGLFAKSYLRTYCLENGEKTEISFDANDSVIYADETGYLLYNHWKKKFIWYDYETGNGTCVRKANYMQIWEKNYFTVCDGNVLVFDDEMNLLDIFEI
jgi:hypothetical protein